MKKLFNRFMDAMRYNTPAKIVMAAAAVMVGILGILRVKAGLTRRALANNSGEGYVDTAVKILIAVVIGALVLAGLYALFNTTVMPTLVQKVQEMFNYKP